MTATTQTLQYNNYNDFACLLRLHTVHLLTHLHVKNSTPEP